MSTTRPSTRSSPSRTKSSSRNILQPAQIPLPPSPPASDGLLPPSSPQPPIPSQPKRRQAVIKSTTTTTTRSPPRRRDNPQSLKAVIESKLTTRKPTSQTRSFKRHPSPAQDPLESSSPPTSPTNRQSVRPTKRLKLSSPSPARSSSSQLLPPLLDTRDSPNNPFLVKPGEAKHRAGAKADESHRQLVYVFRGKRIPYDTTEDLSRTGGSPFGTSGPKFLFPSPPSPAQAPSRKSSSLRYAPQASTSSPIRDSLRAPLLRLETPKRDKSTGGNPSSSNRTASQMLPTPQSHSKKKVNNRQAHPHRPTATTTLNGPLKSGRAMAKVMR